MDNNQRNIQLLGIARKAGLLAVGGEAVSMAARAGKARLIISAADASEGSLRRAKHSSITSRTTHVCVPYTKFELGNVTGRGSPGTVAILDIGIAAGFVRKLAEAQPERYGDTAEILEGMADKSKRKRRAGL